MSLYIYISYFSWYHIFPNTRSQDTNFRAVTSLFGINSVPIHGTSSIAVKGDGGKCDTVQEVHSNVTSSQKHETDVVVVVPGLSSSYEMQGQHPQGQHPHGLEASMTTRWFPLYKDVLKYFSSAAADYIYWCKCTYVSLFMLLTSKISFVWCFTVKCGAVW